MLYPRENAHREVRCLDGYWTFSPDRDDVGFSERWAGGIGGDRRTIAVPASWNEQFNDLYNFHGKGWYEKTVFIPAAWNDRAVWLRVGNAAGKAEVYVNGEKACEHVGTALPFEADIAPLLTFGAENKIVILADSTLDPWSLPPALLAENEGRVGNFNCYPGVTYDFFPFGGLQRSVWLYTTAKTRIEDVTIRTRCGENGATVEFDAVFSAPVRGTLRAETDGVSVEIPVDGSSASGSIPVANPRIWDIGQPELYELSLTLTNGGQEADAYRETYGIRTVKMDGDRLLLNGKPVFFKGFGKHEDFFILGKGFSHAVTVKDFHLLHWVGANSFRTSHYPYDERIMELADREGILVIDETPFVGLNSRMYREDILEKAKSVIGELFARDKNHPCVVMWSLANEPNVDTPEGKHFFEEMAATARALDATRPITYVAHLEPENNLGYAAYDVVCINKYYGWYYAPGQMEEALPDFVACIERFREAFGKPMIIAEFGADAIEGIHSDPPLMFSEEYQRDMVITQYRELKKKPYIIGAHVWCFADFRAAQSISRIILNRKGIFTRDRQPKLLAHALKEEWTKA